MTPVPIMAPADSASVALNSAAAFSSIFALGTVLAVFIVMLGLIFFAGLMFYYFGGQKPGKYIVSSMMSVITRGYTNFWMYIGIVTTFLGLTQVVTAILGSIFPLFTYGLRTSDVRVNSDLRSGLAIFGLGVLVFAIHYYLNNVVENRTQKKGTLLSKMFTGLGLFTTSTVLVVSFYNFVFALLNFSTSSFGGSNPGATLAAIVATLPFWIYFAAKATYFMRFEK